MTATSKRSTMRRISVSAGALAAALTLATSVGAQTVTGRIQGQAAPGAEVVARNTATGAVVRNTAGTDGSYVLAGLQPGTYEITTPEGGTETVTVQIGATATVDLIGGEDEGEVEAVVVTGSRNRVELETSEVATNVTSEQIETLPQTDRNFLAFAALAPGVRYNDSETNKTFRSGASTANEVNVFIDGVSLKNNVLTGGVVGQDSSRGNPFAQLAVREFRVLTQNYKAEYEQAAAAIITAVTKSGTNQFEGEIFGLYQNKDMVQQDFFAERRGDEKPDYRRVQYGAALGGPIIRDRLFFFGSFEANDQDRANTVFLGNRSAANIARFGQFEGQFTSPFRSKLYFGKLTFQADENNLIEFSSSRREESDISGFGGQTAFTAAENKINETQTYNLRYTLRGNEFINEASIDFLEYTFNPTSLSPGEPSLEFQGIITIGGKEATQEISQRGLTLRNDFTYTGLQNHTIKAGARYTSSEYEFNKLFFTTPRFIFRSDVDPTLTIPAQALFGLGNPTIEAENSLFGAFVQDDWDVNERLTLNLGIRWDYETNMFNNDYVTPPAAVTVLNALPRRFGYDPADYITSGDDRPRFKNAFQPRLGFSYDLNGDESLVFFGGYGRYYDRNVFNNTLDERFRLQFTIGNFFFSPNGQPRDGNPTIAFDPRFFTVAGLNELQARAQTGLPELFAVKNDAKPPSTDQFSLGVRRRFGAWVGAVTATYIKGQNGYTHVFGTLNADGSCCDTSAARAGGFANVLLGVDELETRYAGLYFTLDKPYSASSGYGLNLALTLSKAEQTGNDLFSLDEPRPADYGFYRRPGSEDYTLVISGIKDLPYGFRVSTLSTFGSGNFYNIDDFSRGFGPNERNFRRGEGEPDKNCLEIFARCTVDLRLEKGFEFAGNQAVLFTIDLLNAFNNRNFGGYNGFIPPTPEVNAGFGQPNELITRPRSIQVGARYRF